MLRLAAAAGVAAVALGMAGWSNYWVRHKLLRLVSVAERVLTAAARSPAPGSAAGEDGGVPVYIHGARTRPGVAYNSKAAVEAAAGGFRLVEVDLAFSRDLVPYLSHGGDLARRSGRALRGLDAYDSAELDGLLLADGSGLLRFEDFQRRYRERFDGIILDVKTSHARAHEKAQILGALIGPEGERRYRVISLSGVFLRWFQNERPGIPVACESYLAISNRLAGFPGVSWTAADITAGRDRLARGLKLHRLYWTAYTEKDARWILAWRPDATISDLGGEAPPEIPARWRRPGSER